MPGTYENYLELAAAILTQVIEDIRRGPRGANRGHYLSARRFLRSDLFCLICECLGVSPSLARRLILEAGAKEVPGRLAEKERV
ncbi:MAG: hypothetical protein AB1776_05135 [Bacillota bacterium]